MRVRIIVLLAIWLTACAHGEGNRAPIAEPPAMLLGNFVDDYDNRYAISRPEWLQLPHGRFRIMRWDIDGQYLIAQNDSTNASAAGQWTRIDWSALDMPPYHWAFCLSAYEAPTAQAAENTRIARRDNLRTGCNGFPFSRMRRLPE